MANHPLIPRVPTSSLLGRFAARNGRILIVEDNFVNQLLTVSIVTKLGFHTDLAANGSEAVQAMRRGRYDLVLMDVLMPVMDGLAATRLILSSMPAFGVRHPPIIALTGNHTAAAHEECLQAGMSDFLPKPLLPHALVEMLDRWLPQVVSDSA